MENRKIPFVDLNRILKDILPEIKNKIKEIVSNSRFIGSKYVKEFEESFAEYLKVKHCITVNSGTSALYLALKSIDIKPEDEVIIPVNTFIATAEAVSLLGAKSVFVDINEKVYNIDTTKIENAITKRTKAIIPVHLYGQCADMDEINKIAKKYKLWVIEDACQAHGAEYKSKKVGSFGDVAAFSFYPAKNLGAFGEGGAITTSNNEIAEKIKLLRDHGSKQKYYHEIIGGNFRMEEIQGAVLSTKIKFLDKWNETRRNAAKLYNESLKDSEIIAPYETSYNKHVYHLYIVRVKKRGNLQRFLLENGVATGIHYPIPIHLQKAYKDLNYKRGNFPVAEKVTEEILSLPMYPGLSEKEIKFVVGKIKDFYSR